MPDEVLRWSFVHLKLKEYTADGLASILLGLATAKIPWLSWGPIDDILEYLLEKLFTHLIEGSFIKINDLTIKFSSKVDGEAMNKTLDGARVEQRQGITNERRKELNAEIKKNLGNLARYGRAPL